MFKINKYKNLLRWPDHTSRIVRVFLIGSGTCLDVGQVAMKVKREGLIAAELTKLHVLRTANYWPGLAFPDAKPRQNDDASPSGAVGSASPASAWRKCREPENLSALYCCDPGTRKDLRPLCIKLYDWLASRLWKMAA